MIRCLGTAVVMALAACGSPASPTPSAATSSPPPGRTQAEPIDEAKQMAAIEKAIAERGPAVYACRTKAAADDLRVDGEIVLRLTMAADGAIHRVEVARDTVNDPVLATCLVSLWEGGALSASFGEGDGIELPPFSFVSEGVQYLVPTQLVESRRAGPDAPRIAAVLTEANTGNASAELEVIHLDKGQVLERGGAPLADLMYLHRGRAILEVGSKRSEVPVGAGIYAAAAWRYRVTAEDDTVLFRFRVGAMQKSGAGVRVVAPSEARSTAIANGTGTIRLYFDRKSSGEALGSLAVLDGNVGMKVPEHVHDGSSEYLLVVSGEGAMTVEDKRFPIGPGDAIQVPPGVRHSAEILGSQPFRAIQVYTPSGPEQRFFSP